MSSIRNELTRTIPAVVATAVVGGLGTKVKSRWYTSLDKPSWQPPGAAFGPAWTTLYALIATGVARGMARSRSPRARKELQRALAGNLALNTGWTWLFFTARRPDLALAEIAVLNASNLDLIRRLAREDRAAALLLTPYAGWTLFATALNAEIWRRNR